MTPGRMARQNQTDTKTRETSDEVHDVRCYRPGARSGDRVNPEALEAWFAEVTGRGKHATGRSVTCTVEDRGNRPGPKSRRVCCGHFDGPVHRGPRVIKQAASTSP